MATKEDISKELDEIEITNDDDYFDKVLNGDDIVEPKYEDEKKLDASSDTSDKKVEDKSKDKVDSDEVKALKEEIAKLQREAKGRLSDVVQSRQEKAQFKTELQELKTAVSELLAKRDTNDNAQKEELKTPLQETKRPIEFDDDDQGFVDLSDVKEAIKAETDMTRKELEELKAEREFEKMKAEYQRNVNNIINENKDIFVPAYNSLKGIFKDLNDSVIELQERTGRRGEDGTLSQEEALELFDGSPEEKAFLEKHPGIDPTRIARAFNTKLDLRTSLRHIANVNKIGNDKKENQETLDAKLKAAKNKPGSLANSGNQAGATADLIERISNLSFSDLEGLSDAEAAKIEAMLLKEELKGE